MSKWLVAGQWRKTVYKEQMRERRILDNFPHCHHFLLKLDQCVPWLGFINFNLVHHCHHCVQHHQLLACNPRWSWSGKLMSWKYTVWRTWFIISMPWIRLRDFLSNCLKIFISESICFTKSWNSLVSLPCCTMWKQQIWVIGKVCGGLDRQTHLAPSLTEEAVASADGRIAAAVAANRVRSLRKNTAPANSSNNTVLTARQWNVICGIGKCFIQQANAKQGRNPKNHYEIGTGGLTMVVPATAAKDPEKRRTSPRTEPPLSPAFLYSSRVSSDRMKLLMKSSSSDTSNSDFTISCASSTFRQQNISPCHVWDFCHLPIIQLVLHLFDQINQVKTALQHLGKPPY